MNKKYTWIVLLGAVLFLVGWWFLGEVLSNASSETQAYISIAFLVAILLTSGWLMLKR